MGWKLLQFTKLFAYAKNLDNEVKSNVVTKILFVCMGNICRSPMAEGVFRHLLESAGLEDKVYIESAGTHSYHIGASPDSRSQQTTRRRGIIIKDIKARRVTSEDFVTFDYLLAMDKENYSYLLNVCPQPQYRPKIQLFLDYAPALHLEEVPDPYYGGLNGFEQIMDLIEEAARGLLHHIRAQHHL